jgi:hypothetical protein
MPRNAMRSRFRNTEGPPDNPEWKRGAMVAAVRSVNQAARAQFALMRPSFLALCRGRGISRPLKLARRPPRRFFSPQPTGDFRYAFAPDCARVCLCHDDRDRLPSPDRARPDRRTAGGLPGRCAAVLRAIHPQSRTDPPLPGPQHALYQPRVSRPVFFAPTSPAPSLTGCSPDGWRIG